MSTPEEDRILGEPNATILLTNQRVTYDEIGRPIEYSESAYRSDRYTYDMTLVAPPAKQGRGKRC
jgi:GntR family transcriptional regulator